MGIRPLVSHVGIAVSDLEKAVALYRRLLGAGEPFVAEVPEASLRLAMLGDDCGGRVELLTPDGKSGDLARFIEAKGEGLHHICLYVDDIEQAMESLRRDGVQLIDQKPRLGALGVKVAFVHPSGMNGVLLELEERLK